MQKAKATFSVAAECWGSLKMSRVAVDRVPPSDGEVLFRYCRRPHVLPALVFVSMALACLYLACSALDGVIDLPSLLYVFAMLGGAACTAQAAWLSARHVLAPQHLLLSPTGLSASYIEGGQILEGQAFEGFSVEKSGIILRRKNEKPLRAVLSTRTAIETRGIDGDPGHLISILQKYLPRH